MTAGDHGHTFNFFGAVSLQRMTAGTHRLMYGCALVSAMCLTGCAVEVQNTQAAHELARRAEPTGSVYAGWRVFQDRCAGCQGVQATGSAGAPDLLPGFET